MPSLPGRRPSLLLEVDLTAAPSTDAGQDPVARLLARGRPGLQPLLRALHRAAADPHVVGLVAKVGGPLPWATMQELHLGVRSFAASGKPTVAWAESFDAGAADMTAYVLATAFDEIWLQPSGGLGPMGVAVETTFVRGALDRLGVEPQLDQRHEFKSAADRVMRTGFTDAHRESLDRLAESIFSDAVAMIVAGRGMEAAHVRDLVDAGPHLAQEALARGMVDHLGYRDEVLAAIRSRAGRDAELLFADRWHPPRRPAARLLRPGHVALVEVTGTIVAGRTRRGPLGRQSGSDTVGAALRAAAQDERARAVVLRVDSPGGSAVASDTIWREVCRVRDIGRPVVVSMGRVAASGGYLVACPADVIVALPSTITGSIGVFGGKVVTRELLDRLGLSTGTVWRGDRALMYSTRQGFTPEDRAKLAAALDAIYADFVAKVAQGRQRSQAEVEQAARGRVWTGADARERGLVDELGGRHDALRIARLRGDLPADAPLRAAIHVPPLARLGRPRSSEDPRAASTAAPGLPDVARALGLASGHVLEMAPVHVR